ncbi:MAG: PaaI family thioesterase [Sneathiella sp.]
MTDSLTANIHQRMPLCETLDVQALSLDKTQAVFSMNWSHALTTGHNILHGGAIMALADATGAAVASENLPEDAIGTSTIESKTNFLGAVKDGTVIATATPLHVGYSTIVVETEIRKGEKLVAKVTQTQTVLRKRN